MALVLRVLYGDTDQMGVVYYANYLRFFEAGRGEYLRARGGGYPAVERRGLRLPVVEASVRYHRPARYDDLLTVETSLIEAGGASVRFAYRVVRGQEDLARGETRHACVDFAGKPQRLPPDLARLVDVAQRADSQPDGQER